ncbi:MAG TPA: GntR family transcriptional regulator [Aquella sp.]|nr:GntR family transcriptional regulator [Aquella sp.]
MTNNETLTSFCITKIRDLILSGELPPGARIKGDYLKNYLSVGLSPIREALSRLVHSNLVEFTDNVGFKVPELTVDKVHDTYKSYAKIETLVFREAIENGSETWESGVMAELYRLSKIEVDGIKAPYQAWSIRNEDFHEALINGCSLEGLKQVRKHFINIKNWYHSLAYRNSYDEQIEVNHAEHSKLAKLAIARKTDAASFLLYTHTMHSIPSLISKLKNHGYLSDK